MAEIRTFEDLIVWQKAHGLFLEAARDTGQSGSKFKVQCSRCESETLNFEPGTLN